MTTKTAAEQVVEILETIKRGLDEGCDNGGIIDTLWASGTETLFDYIDRELERWRAEQGGAPKTASQGGEA